MHYNYKMEVKLLFKKEQFESDRYKCIYSGMPVKIGIKAGGDSLKWLLEKIENDNISIEKASRYITGYYVILIIDKQDNRKYVFVDNSSVYKIYYSNKYCSDSFIELAKKENKKFEDASMVKILEFLRFGFNFYPETLFDDIWQLHGNNILEIDDSGNSKLLNKSNDIESISIEEYFKGLAQSLKGLKISADITGGIDSRLIVLLSKQYGIDFELAVNGNEVSEDVRIAEKISNKLKQKLMVFDYDVLDNAEEFLIKSMQYCEGYTNALRILNGFGISEARKRKNMDMILTGVGGEFFKEFLLMHEFPFYTLGKLNVYKTFKMRFEPIPFQYDLLTGEIAKFKDAVEQSILDKMKDYVVSSKAKSLNSIWYYMKIPAFHGKFATSILQNFHDAFSPFLDFQIFLYAQKMSLKYRILDLFHRELITRLNPKIAEVETSQLVSVSNKTFYILKDIFFTIINRIKRIVRKFTQKYLKKTILLESSLADDFFYKIKKLPVTEQYVDYLKRRGIVRKEVKTSSIRNNILGNIISLAYLFIKLDDEA